jgi:hypothetical protein
MRPKNEVVQHTHPRHDEWTETSVTIVDDEPVLLTVRKMEAPPCDNAEMLETVREQLHEKVDALVNTALESVDELNAIVERSEREKGALAEELAFVVQHSNALIEATAPPPRRREDTLIEFPRRRREDTLIEFPLPPHTN